MKKVLYLKGSGLGDIVSSIPKLSFLKDSNNYIVWCYFGNFNSFHLNFLLLLKENNLINEIVCLYSKFDFIKFILKNFLGFDKVLIGGIQTKNNYIFSKFLSRNIISFIKYKNIINESIIKLENQGLDNDKIFLYNYDFFYYKNKNIDGDYIVYYPSTQKRSIDIKYVRTIFNLFKGTNINIVLIGGKREEWFLKFIEDIKDVRMVSYIGKEIDYKKLANILHYSKFNILHNGGIMWLGNLVNKNNINLHTISYKIWRPLEDGKGIYNFYSDYKKIGCEPCEGKCIFKNEKFRCKYIFDIDKVIHIIQKLISN